MKTRSTASRRPRATIEYEVAFDKSGQQIFPGDYVSVKLYPRGTLRGTVAVSPRVKVVLADGSTVPALIVLAEDDGKAFSLPGPKGVTKLKRK